MRNTDEVMSEDEQTGGRDQEWATWLQGQLDERSWRQADLVRESGSTIKADRVSKWLSGKELPTYRSATIIAHTLGLNRDYVLEVAGYDRVEVSEERRAAARARLAATPHIERLKEYTDTELAAEMLRRAERRVKTWKRRDGLDMAILDDHHTATVSGSREADEIEAIAAHDDPELSERHEREHEEP